jgi:hypothetical protein
MEKDILRYFIDYCKDSNGIFNVDVFVKILEQGIILTNDKDEFQKPVDDIYLISNTETFNRLYYYFNIEDFEERQTDNGFENPGLIQLQTNLGVPENNDGYQIVDQYGMVELVSGNSKFLDYPELFTISEIDEVLRMLLLEKGVVICYDVRYNNIILSSVETWLKYAEGVQLIFTSNLMYSVTGDVEVGGINPV